MTRPTLSHRHGTRKPLGVSSGDRSLIQKISWFSAHGTPKYAALVGQIFFTTDDATLDGQDYLVLNQLVDAFRVPLLGHEAHISCVGKADYRGSSRYNSELGSLRAKVVKAYLDSKLSSYSNYSSSVKNEGELYSAASDDEVDLAADRRVDLLSSYVIPRTIHMDETVITVGESLEFNGNRLCWFVNGDVDMCWSAVSGRPGYMRREFQAKEDKGPLPEGRWIVRQSEYQKMPSRGWMERIGAELGRTAWPGGASAWGRHRVWLEPEEGTKTYGRSGFSIHGGDTPGSAGCIDLTIHAPEFIRKFLQYGKDVRLNVDYTKSLPERPSHGDL